MSMRRMPQPPSRSPAHLQLVRTLRPIARLAVSAVAAAAIVQPAVAHTQCEASAYGVRPGADDNVAALSHALTVCAGQTLHIAAGTYDLSPKGFATGLTVPTGTTIAGDGREGPTQTVLRVASSGNFQAVLWIRNVSN